MGRLPCPFIGDVHRSQHRSARASYSGHNLEELPHAYFLPSSLSAGKAISEWWYGGRERKADTKTEKKRGGWRDGERGWDRVKVGERARKREERERKPEGWRASERAVGKRGEGEGRVKLGERARERQKKSE